MNLKINKMTIGADLKDIVLEDWIENIKHRIVCRIGDLGSNSGPGKDFSLFKNNIRSYLLAFKVGYWLNPYERWWLLKVLESMNYSENLGSYSKWQ